MFDFSQGHWSPLYPTTENIIGASVGAVAIGGIALLTAPVAVPAVIGAAGIVGAGVAVASLSTTALTCTLVGAGVIAGAVAGHNAGSKDNLANAGGGIDIVKNAYTIATNLNTPIPKPNAEPSSTTKTTIWSELRKALFGRGHR